MKALQSKLAKHIFNNEVLGRKIIKKRKKSIIKIDDKAYKINKL